MGKVPGNEVGLSGLSSSKVGSNSMSFLNWRTEENLVVNNNYIRVSELSD